jgi:hypothetical protein
VVTSGTEPAHLVLVSHHVVADGHALTVLERDFFAALAGGLDGAPTGPGVILAHEQSPAGLRRGEAALAYWTKMLAEVPPAVAGEPPYVQATVVSAPLLAAARQVAARLRASVPNVVLSAFCTALFGLTDDDRLAVRLLSSNRFDPYRRDIVTSMNQWVPIVVDRLSTPDPARLVREIGKRAMVAYAHGVYDVDEVFRLLDGAGFRPGQYDSLWSFNFVSHRPRDPLPSEPPDRAESPERVTVPGVPEVSTAPEDEPIHWAPPFSSVGPRCYLRAIEGSDLRLELRVPTNRSSVAAELIRRMRLFLVEASRTS